jgi:hypothetical protein
MSRLLAVLVLAACGEPAPEETDAGTLAACDLADANATCPACSDGELACTFEDVSATRNSCGECQARGALYEALCDAGETATEQEILDGTTCAP